MNTEDVELTSNPLVNLAATSSSSTSSSSSSSSTRTIPNPTGTVLLQLPQPIVQPEAIVQWGTNIDPSASAAWPLNAPPPPQEPFPVSWLETWKAPSKTRTDDDVSMTSTTVDPTGRVIASATTNIYNQPGGVRRGVTRARQRIGGQLATMTTSTTTQPIYAAKTDENLEAGPMALGDDPTTRKRRILAVRGAIDDPNAYMYTAGGVGETPMIFDVYGQTVSVYARYANGIDEKIKELIRQQLLAQGEIEQKRAELKVRKEQHSKSLVVYSEVGKELALLQESSKQEAEAQNQLVLLKQSSEGVLAKISQDREALSRDWIQIIQLANAAAKDLQGQGQEIVSAIEKVKQESDAATKQITLYKQKKTELSDAYRKLATEQAQEKLALEEAEKQKKALEEQVSKLKESVQIVGGIALNLSTDQKALLLQKQEADRQLAEANQTIATLQATRTQSSKEVEAKLNNFKEEAARKAKESQDKRTALEKRLKEAEDKMAAISQKATERQNELNALVTVLETKEQEYATLEKNALEKQNAVNEVDQKLQIVRYQLESAGATHDTKQKMLTAMTNAAREIAPLPPVERGVKLQNTAETLKQLAEERDAKLKAEAAQLSGVIQAAMQRNAAAEAKREQEERQALQTVAQSTAQEANNAALLARVKAAVNPAQALQHATEANNIVNSSKTALASLTKLLNAPETNKAMAIYQARDELARIPINAATSGIMSTIKKTLDTLAIARIPPLAMADVSSPALSLAPLWAKPKLEDLPMAAPAAPAAPQAPPTAAQVPPPIPPTIIRTKMDIDEPAPIPIPVFPDVSVPPPPPPPPPAAAPSGTSAPKKKSKKRKRCPNKPIVIMLQGAPCAPCPPKCKRAPAKTCRRSCRPPKDCCVIIPKTCRQ